MRYKLIMQYNNSWGICILLSSITYICNLFFKIPFFGLVSTFFLIGALYICYIHSKKDGIAKYVIPGRKNSIFSMKAHLFKRYATVGLFVFVVAEMIVLITGWFWLAFATWTYLLFIMGFIYLWNIGFIRHKNFTE